MRFGAFDAVFRRQRRAAGDVPENGVRFGEIAVGRDFQQRNLAARILGEEFRRAAGALQDVDFHELERNAEPGQRQADLVAVAGPLIRIERVHCRIPRSGPPRTIGQAKSGNYKAALAQRVATFVTRRSKCHASNAQDTKYLFRGYAVRARVFQQSVVVDRLDRREIAVRDQFRPRELGDVVRAGAQRQIDDLARVGRDVGRRGVHQIAVEHQHRAGLAGGRDDADAVGGLPPRRRAASPSPCRASITDRTW